MHHREQRWSRILLATLSMFLLAYLVVGGCTKAKTVDPLGPILNLQPQALDFGVIEIGSYFDRTFIVSNAGDGILAGTVSETCADFLIASGGGTYNLGAGELREVTVRFEPSSAGTTRCSIPFGANDAVDCVGIGSIPEARCEFDPPQLDFGLIALGSSSDLAFTIRNAGGGTLSGSIEQECEEFIVVSGSGEFELGAGASHQITIRFRPMTEELRVCEISTGLTECPTYACAGEALMYPPECGVSVSELDFGLVEIGASADWNFSITNSGGNVLSGSVSLSCDAYEIVSGGWPYALAAGESLHVVVRFTPDQTGDFDCAVDPGNTICDGVLCTGTGTDPPRCTISPPSLDFGELGVGAFRDLAFSISNSGGGILTGAISADCESFTVVSGGNGYSLGAGQRRTVTIRFLPKAPGEQICTIDTDNPNCGGVICTGEGLESNCAVKPTSLDYGEVTIGTFSDLSFSITNEGTQTISGLVREVCDDTAVISGGGSYTLRPGDPPRIVTVRFAPKTAGPHECQVTLGGACLPVETFGTGTASEVCEVSPTVLDFGVVPIGESSERYFRLTNTGNGTLAGVIEELCDAYEIVSGSGAYSLQQNESRDVLIRFGPHSEGTLDCTVETGQAFCSDVRCTGTGSSDGPVCSVAPEQLDFGRVEIGAVADETFTITNLGGGLLTGSVSKDCPEYEILSGEGAYSLGSGESASVTVRFAPESEGTTLCTIDTGNEECVDVSCEGEGFTPTPICSVTPVTLDFGSIAPGATAELSFSISNVGEGVVSGDVSEACDRFSILEGEGTFNLGADETLIVTVQFAPDGEGAFGCTIQTGYEGCETVDCLGEALENPPVCLLSPETLDFGNIPVGAQDDRIFTITNTGGGLLTGTVTDTCTDYAVISGGGAYELEPEEFREVTVRFSPQSGGTNLCSIGTGSVLCGDIACTGVGIASDCLVEPTSLAFEDTPVGGFSDLGITITNVGNAELIGSVTEDCPDFLIIAGAGNYAIAPGGFLDVTVRFEPVSIGLKNCTVETGSISCGSIPCLGAALGPICRIDPPSLDFGQVDVNDTDTRSFIIQNAGGGVLEGMFSETCADYAILSGASFNLTNGDSQQVVVEFAPQTLGISECSIAPGSEYCAPVVCSGVGLDVVCVIDPTSLDFGDVLVGEIEVRDFTIRNDGNTNMVGSTAENCVEYSILIGFGPFDLGPGEELDVTIQFAPQFGGVSPCTITTGTEDCEDVSCTGVGIGANCDVTPTAINFGDVNIGESADTTFTITNMGGGTLSGVVSELCSDYAIIGTDSYALGPDEAQIFTVRFTPQSAGYLPCTIDTGSIRCSDVDCAGEGVGPICDVSPTFLDFGQVHVDSTDTRIFTVSNNGGGSLTGTVIDTCTFFSILSGASYDLANGESQDVVIEFAPQTPGIFDCSLDPGNAICAEVDCSAEAIGPICDVFPIALDFGDVLVGDAADSTFTITNSGTANLVGSVSELCDDYVILSGDGPFDLAPEGSLVVTVRFEPQSGGSSPCTIETGADVCSDVACTGVGLGPSCDVSPVAIDFGPVEIGLSADSTFTITNTGGGILAGTVNESCDDYEIIGIAFYALGVGQSQGFTVRFTPQSEGPLPCVIDTGNTLCTDVDCTGEGIGPVCEITPSSIDFGQLGVGESADSTFTITNTGGGTLTGFVSEACPDYLILGGSGAFALGSGQEQIVTVRFSPQSEGTKLCDVTTGTEDCVDVSCSGVGIGAACDVEPSNIDFGAVLVGAVRDTTFTIKNSGLGILSGNVSEACVDYSLVSGGGVYDIAGGDSIVVTVRFAPQTDGTLPCTIETGLDLCSDVACTGVGLGPECEVSRSAIDFGQVLIGEFADSSFTITNTGGGSLSGTVTETCDDYEVTGGATYSLGAGQQQSVTVRFGPGSVGDLPCTIDLGNLLCADISATGFGCPDCPDSPAVISASTDVMISSADANSNFCADDAENVGRDLVATETFEILYRFDLSTIPVGATITTVSFEAYLDSCRFEPAGDSVTVRLAELTGPFDECATTWNTAPGRSALSCADTLFCAPGGYATIPCTALVPIVQSWVDDAGTNDGMAIQPATAAAGSAVLRSRRHADMTPPRLVIEFSCPCP